MWRYIAFRQDLRGFIPDAGLVYAAIRRLLVVANLTNEMLHLAGSEELLP
jgi:hypothetical protein